MASRYWGGLPSPPPADHIVSELSTMTPLSRVAQSSQLLKPLHHDKAVICEGSKKQQSEPCVEQMCGSRWRKEYVRAVCSHPVCLTYTLSAS